MDEQYKKDKITKRFREKREIGEILSETFGCEFGLSWFFPIKIGGYWPYYRNLMKGKKRN